MTAARRKKVTKEIRAMKARQLETRAAKTIVRAISSTGSKYALDPGPRVRYDGPELYEILRAAITAAVPGRQKYPNVEKPLLDGVKAAAAAMRRVKRRIVRQYEKAPK
jgi:hypothetical protein